MIPILTAFKLFKHETIKVIPTIVADRHCCFGVINCFEKETAIITNFKTDWKEIIY